MKIELLETISQNNIKEMIRARIEKGGELLGFSTCVDNENQLIYTAIMKVVNENMKAVDKNEKI